MRLPLSVNVSLRGVATLLAPALLLTFAAFAGSSSVSSRPDVADESPSTVTLQAGDLIVSGFSPNDNSNEWIELFNTTGLPISLEEMEIVTRLDVEPDGILDIDWTLSADLSGLSIAPHSFFLIAEGATTPDLQLSNGEIDLSTGEMGTTERALSLELTIGGTHMDYVLYGRHDGSDSGAFPPGDLPFDGVSFPRSEVIRTVQGAGFSEGVTQRVSVGDLYAGFEVEGFYTDENSLPESYPVGVWTSAHNTSGGNAPRDSTTPSILPPGPLCIAQIIDSTGDDAGHLLDKAGGIAVDASGNVYVAGLDSDNVFKITPDGTIAVFLDASGDGTNSLNEPWAIAVDDSGNVYVGGRRSDNVFKVTPAGTKSQIIDAAGDGAGNLLTYPSGIAVDGLGNVFVAGQWTANVFKITPSGTITQIIDSTGDAVSGDFLSNPRGVATDASGNVLVSGSREVFRITPSGIISQIIDSSGDGAGTQLFSARGVATDASGNVFVAGSVNAFKITPSGVITAIINNLNSEAIAVDSSGNVYLSGSGATQVLKITPAGTATEIIDSSGDGMGNGLDGPKLFGIAIDGAGHVYATGDASDNAFRIPAFALDCDDGNSCTDDSCDDVLGCVNSNNSNPCDDGNACTAIDVCSAGVCQPGAPPDCSDGASCTDDTCDFLYGCLNVDTCSPGKVCNASSDTCEPISIVQPGDLIISGFSPNDNSNEWVELFNTTSQPISLEGMELVSRVDREPDGILDLDWALSADLTGLSVAPRSFFLVGEGATGGDLALPTGSIDLSTGEMGTTERALSLQLKVDGAHLDYVLYGRHDGSDSMAVPPGDLAFDGVSYPRIEVIRTVQGAGFDEGVTQRSSDADLYAGYDVDGFYTDEGSLPGGHPDGVWTSAHGPSGGNDPRDSTTAAVLPPSRCITQIIDGTADGMGNFLNSPGGIAVDRAGTVYVTGRFTDNAFKITPAGVVTQIIDVTGDGVGQSLNNAGAVTVDSSGNVYVTGEYPQGVFKISPNGMVTTIIYGDGDGIGNLLQTPNALAADDMGNVYVTGRFSDNAFKITPSGVITQIIDEAGDGAGNVLESPSGVAVDGSGNVYVSGEASNNLFRIAPGGLIEEILGSADGVFGPSGVAVDGSGNVFVAAYHGSNVLKITPSATVTEVISGIGDGENPLLGVSAIAVDGLGTLYVTGALSDNVFKVKPDGTVTEIINGLDLEVGPSLAAHASGNVYLISAAGDSAFRIPPVFLQCDDGEDCTDDTCDESLGCVSTNNTAPCEDGDACSVGDICSAGVCVSGSPLVCTDSLGCTTDSCDPVFGCRFDDSCPPGKTCEFGGCDTLPWRPTRSMLGARTSHTATLLQSGQVLVAGGDGAELYDPQLGSWTPTGAPQENRKLHTATLLPSGSVLVVGGLRMLDDVATGTTEQFDPQSGDWILTDPLQYPRAEHTATLLPSGKILVVGGRDTPHNAMAAAELYDPVEGTWTATGELHGARSGHTATLLPSGKVLVAGGSKQQLLATAELYDPEAGTWSPVLPMSQPRTKHSATVLPSGKVLVAGGENFFSPDGTVELYDPETQVWVATDSMGVGRGQHSAALLPSGNVLVVGGVSWEFGPISTIESAEIYDPVAGTWFTAAAPDSRAAHTATVLSNGEVLIAGGFFDFDEDPLILATAKLYAEATPYWTATNAPETGRLEHTATLLPTGDVLVTGGRIPLVDWFALGSADLYNPEFETWSRTDPMPTGRFRHTATLLPSGKVLVAGGLNTVTLASTLLYDAAAGTWTPSGPMSDVRADHTATLLPSGKVLVAGGGVVEMPFYDYNLQPPFLSPPVATTELFDPSAGVWTPSGSMSNARTQHTSTALLDGRVLVVGGGVATAELYDPRTETWSTTGALGNIVSGHSATLLPSGQVLVAGGYYPSGLITPASQLYDPATGIWTATEPMAYRRFDHSAILLPAGRVLVTAGWTSEPDSPVRPSRAFELFDPATNSWSQLGHLSAAIGPHTLTPIPIGDLLLVGNDLSYEAMSIAQLLHPSSHAEDRRPVVTPPSSAIGYDHPISIEGTNFGGDSEGSSGGTNNSAVNYPLVTLRNIESGHLARLEPDAQPNFWDDPITLTVSEFPPVFDPGWHLLTVTTAGVPSESRIVDFSCSLTVSQEPSDQQVNLDTCGNDCAATFDVQTRGGRFYQWQQCVGDDTACSPGSGNWSNIAGATGTNYTTPPVTGPEAGTKYRVLVNTGCMEEASQPATLLVLETEPPVATVLSPNGGEYWLLSEDGSPPSTQVVTWSMSDNVRICQVEVELLYSNDGGASYNTAPAGGGLPASFGPGGACANPGEATTSIVYQVPTIPPSGTAGSLYKVRVRVQDHAGEITEAESPNPFFVVQPNPDSVRTLILSNVARMESRMGISPVSAGSVRTKLQELAGHPRVLGLVVDLDGVTDVVNLYSEWDADPANAEKANAVLLGCHAPLPSSCAAERDGIHDTLSDLLEVYTGVEYLILVGDDRIIPFARLQDDTVLLLESTYLTPQNLTASSTVGQALAADFYLSDDPLATAGRIELDNLNSDVLIPNLSTGRLVEQPEEIVTTIATFISQDGILDLSVLDDVTGHKVLISGYDFLIDSGRKIRERWKSTLGVSTPDDSLAPVDGELLTSDWGEATVDDRRSALRDHLSGNGGARYGVASLSGHATHFEAGVPGVDPLDIAGLGTEDIYGQDDCVTPTLGSLSLAGSVIYAVGCHSGLPVPGTCATDADHSLDLPQTFLSRGVQTYVANTGYGWGLVYGIGYGERLAEILTEELTQGGVIVMGDAVRRSKQRYLLETPLIDAYDEKSLMQWTLYGLPMYAVQTGIDPEGSPAAPQDPPRGPESPEPGQGDVELLGAVTVQRAMRALDAPPAYLTRVDLHFDFTGPGVYTKRNALGDALPDDPGCPDPAPGDPEGCYYTLNALVDRGTGEGDLPIQPYLVYDSRLSGTSQHGVLWKGGTYNEEDNWTPVIGELASNGGDGSNHGSTPRTIMLRPRPRKGSTTEPDGDCQASDLEISSVVLATGEALKDQDTDPSYDIQRTYREMDLEVFYFNNTQNSSENCDREGPLLGEGPHSGDHHEVVGTTIEWAVPVSDTAGVWRVVLVYNEGTPAGQGQGSWLPLELTDDGGGIWRGSLAVPAASRVTYVVQAVDNRGNVTWLDYVATELPSSGIDVGVPEPVDVAIVVGNADVAVEMVDAPDPVMGSQPLAYTITVTNLGPDPASTVTVAQTLPTGASFVLAGGAGWSCDELGGMVTCTRDLLMPGTSPAITVLTNAPDAGELLTSVAMVSAFENDPNPGNDTRVEQTTLLACAAPTEAVYIDSMTLDGNNNPVLSFMDPNQPAVISGYNVYRSFQQDLPKEQWPRVATNVVDMDAGTPNLQWVDTSGQEPPEPGDVWFYQVTAYNGPPCDAEGPFGWPVERVCADGEDDDFDTLVDCEDPDCMNVCVPLPIQLGDSWRYLKGTEEPAPYNAGVAYWAQPEFDDTSWAEGPGGFGYGADCPALHNTVLDDMPNGYVSVYVRRVFLVEDASQVETLDLTVDYDDAWVAYLNGVEVARSPGMGGAVGVPPTYDQTASTPNHECSGGNPANPPELFDLDSAIPLLVTGANVIAVQGHNRTLGSSDFSLIPTLESTSSGP